MIPELGPALGRLTLPPSDNNGPIRLDGIRLELTNAIFELGADARAWSAAGDRQAAIEALNRSAWLTAWEAAVRSAADLVAQATDARITAAAMEARLPRRRRDRILLSPAERRALHARLGRGGMALAEALEELDREGEQLRHGTAGDRKQLERWREALAGAARHLESAWLSLEQAVRAEWDRWTALVESARRWRRPRWVLWTVTALVVGAAIYLGLVIGGYVPVPPPLADMVQWWWEAWDRIVEPL